MYMLITTLIKLASISQILLFGSKPHVRLGTQQKNYHLFSIVASSSTSYNHVRNGMLHVLCERNATVCCRSRTLLATFLPCSTLLQRHLASATSQNSFYLNTEAPLPLATWKKCYGGVGVIMLLPSGRNVRK